VNRDQYLQKQKWSLAEVRDGKPSTVLKERAGEDFKTSLQCIGMQIEHSSSRPVPEFLRPEYRETNVAG
jgi:hypothetical protein